MKRFGKYLFLDRISSGGMADVYRAKLVGIRGFTKTIAIKRIHPHLLERRRFLRMFTDEAKIASRLAHPNIVQIYDLGEEEGVPYIAMEYVAGRDLYRVVQKLVSLKRRCPWQLATRVVADVCEGLHHAHAFRSLDGQPQEIVHRDVSPRNVLISYTGDVKLTDFGVARARDREEHTEHGMIKGKVRYISPEGASGQPVDGRSDLYSLGVVLAEMLTMVPFRKGKNEVEILLDVREGKFDRGGLAALPAPMQGVLDRALARDPDDRYPDALTFRDDLLSRVNNDTRPMTTVELAEFMQELYARDIEKERDGDSLAGGSLVEAARTPPSIRGPASGRIKVRMQPDGNPLALNLPASGPVPAQAQPDTQQRPKLEGDLLHTSFPRLLHRLREAEELGRLDLRRDPVEKTLYFEHGDPTFAVSNVEREFFGEYLVARGALSREQHASILDLAANEGMRFMEAALAERALPPNEMYRLLADQIRDRILELFSWTGGVFAFYSGVESPEPGMPINLRSHLLIHEGVQDRVPLVVIRRRLEGMLRQRLNRTGGDLPPDLQLSGRQQRILRTIEEKRPSAADLIKTEKDEEQVLRLLYMLHEIERIEFADPDE